MNTISIDSDIYHGAEMYAKLHNISVRDVIEKSITMLVGKFQLDKSKTHGKQLEQAMALMDTMMVKGGKAVPADSEEFNNALAFVKTKAAKGGKPVPANEKGLDALIDTKYKL